MRLRPLAVMIAAGLSLFGCQFDGSGLTGNTPASLTDESTGDASGTTAEQPTSTTDPTGGAVCGNFQVEGDEECDNGEANNGGGAVCRDDCVLNTCGDSYVATFQEGCDDGNTVDGDGCSAICELEGCGDGMTKGMEQCDDGNSVDDDGCTNLCRLPQCGDGIKNGTEQCDEPSGNTETSACVPGCKNAVCGDGFVQDGVEGCDDMNAVDDDACSNSCIAASCGDGMIQAGETCDDGNQADDDDCLNNCAMAACGDGVLHTGSEQCDDGNITPGDTCSATCFTEVCGNGMMDPGEACDDGNQDNTDGCLNSCDVASCGDGFVQTGMEDCDDKNDVNTDDCTNMCKAGVCGDGIVKDGPSEECDANMLPTSTCDGSCKRSAYWVFSSSVKMTGLEVMDLLTADAQCTSLSMGTAVEGKYKAFLGNSTETAAERLFHSSVKYQLPSKGVIATNWGDLINGSLNQPINRDQNNVEILKAIDGPANCGAADTVTAVWTGSKPDGTNGGLMFCGDWMTDDMGMSGQGGILTKTNTDWSNCVFKCDTKARLYCVEQPPK